MLDPVISFDHVYKKFARGEQHTTLRDFLPAFASRLLGFRRPEPQDLRAEEFWAVRDLSFAVGKGEALGIIGPNGSGKSTALKLLSGIIRPDQGTYRVQGRLSALIEVGAGFHPDLTGRENVFLNGRILGMTRKEIQAKFNRIVEFAGVEEFIDTPVKRYSSGMAVRLGFAVSAFIEPDVLLVDEVLAVGDVEFRNRCMNRMDQMRRNGVTMILVSHNLAEVRNLCERTVLLFKGQKVMEGPTQKVIEHYHQAIGQKLAADQDRDAEREARPKDPEAPIELTRVELLDGEGLPAENFYTGAPMTMRVHFHARRRIERPRVDVELVWSAEDWEAVIFSNKLDDLDLPALEGHGFIDLKIDTLLAEPSVYHFNVTVVDEQTRVIDSVQRKRFLLCEGVPVPGIFGLTHSWQVHHRPASGPARVGQEVARASRP